MHIISYDFNMIGWQELRSDPKVLKTCIHVFIHVTTHDQKKFGPDYLTITTSIFVYSFYLYIKVIFALQNIIFDKKIGFENKF